MDNPIIRFALVYIFIHLLYLLWRVADLEKENKLIRRRIRDIEFKMNIENIEVSDLYEFGKFNRIDKHG
jgi:hypothetical protein